MSIKALGRFLSLAKRSSGELAPLEISDAGRLLVDSGADINIASLTISYQAVVPDGAVPSAPLAADATFTSPWFDVKDFASIKVLIFADAASAANGVQLQGSVNGVDISRTVSATLPANLGVPFSFAPPGRYVRFHYINGPVAQTRLDAQVLFYYYPAGSSEQILGAGTTDNNISTITKSHLAGRIYTGPATGAWAPVQVDSTGRISIANFPASPADYPLPQAQVDALTPLQFPASQVVTNAVLSDVFRRALKFEPLVGEEIRREETATDDYHGIAPDGTAEATASWTVVRFYKDVIGNVTRVRHRANVAWTDRAVGW